MIVVGIIAVLSAIAIPNFLKAQTRTQTNICIENLAQIQSAKTLWALEQEIKEGDPVTVTDIIGPALYIQVEPECPAGGAYTYNSVGTTPTCNIDGHVLYD